jgi:hypothetical protein
MIINLSTERDFGENQGSSANRHWDRKLPFKKKAGSNKKQKRGPPKIKNKY